MSLPQRRIEDRIRVLCLKAVAASDADLEPIVRELAELLHGTIGHLRNSAASLLVDGDPLLEPRRRENDKLAASDRLMAGDSVRDRSHGKQNH